MLDGDESDIKLNKRSTLLIVCYRCNHNRSREELSVDGEFVTPAEAACLVYVCRQECPQCTCRLLVTVEIPTGPEGPEDL